MFHNVFKFTKFANNQINVIWSWMTSNDLQSDYWWVHSRDSTRNRFWRFLFLFRLFKTFLMFLILHSGWNHHELNNCELNNCDLNNCNLSNCDSTIQAVGRRWSRLGDHSEAAVQDHFALGKYEFEDDWTR